jgi:hypothetical protein
MLEEGKMSALTEMYPVLDERMRPVLRVSIHANIRICQEDDTQLTGAAWGLVSHILMHVLSYFPLRMKLS